MPPKRRFKSRSKPHVADFSSFAVYDNVYSPDFEFPPDVEPQIQPAEELDGHELDDEVQNRKLKQLLEG